MNGAEHYAAAEQLLSDASFTHGITGEPCTRHGQLMTHQQHDALIARAQVHATLALAAQALPTGSIADEDVRHCGKHTGNASNRCLLAEGHGGNCDDDPAEVA